MNNDEQIIARIKKIKYLAEEYYAAVVKPTIESARDVMNDNQITAIIEALTYGNKVHYSNHLSLHGCIMSEELRTKFNNIHNVFSNNESGWAGDMQDLKCKYLDELNGESRIWGDESMTIGGYMSMELTGLLSNEYIRITDEE